MRPTRVAALAAVVTSAYAFTLFERNEWPWVAIGWVALVPWLAVLDRTRSLRQALYAGLLMCFAFVLAIFGWFPRSVQEYTGAPWVAGLAFLLVLAPILDPQFIVFACARYVARRGSAPRLWRTAFIGACAYVGAEWACPRLFAETLGHGLYGSPLMRQAADLAGAQGLTFLLIIGNECVLAIVRGSFARNVRQVLAPATCLAAIVCGLLLYGTVRYKQFRTDQAAGDGTDVSAGIVQADISHYNQLAVEMGTFDAVRMILDTHFALSSQMLQSDRVDLLVWPETVYPTTFGSPKSEDGAAFDRQIGGFVTSIGVPLVFGSYDIDGAAEFNAAVFLEPAVNGRMDFETYRKVTLFPLTERVPAVLDFKLIRQWMPWLGTWTPGKGAQVLPLKLRDGRTLRVAPLICYDAVDPSLAIAAVRRGADIIVTLSNDVWFAASPAPRMHLIISAFRSIETRRPQIRATNTGMSAVITATGDFRGTLGVHERATLVGRLRPEEHATTLMVLWGDWLGPAGFTCAVLFLGAILFRRLRPAADSPAVSHIPTTNPRARRPLRRPVARGRARG